MSLMQANMSGLEKFKPELAVNAKKIVLPGKGLLACDESTGTVGKRLVREFCLLRPTLGHLDSQSLFFAC